MNTEETIDTETDNEISEEDKTPFPWKKVLLAPFKALWCVVFYLAKSVWWVARIALKTAWWFTKLALFFAFAFLGIFIVIGASFSSRTREANETYLERERLDEEHANRVASVCKGGYRCFRVAGALWRSLWGGKSEED